MRDEKGRHPRQKDQGGEGWIGGIWTTARFKEAGRVLAQPIRKCVLEVPDGVEGALDRESGRPPKNLGSETGILPASLSLWTLWV